MRLLLVTTDHVLLSFVAAVLADAGIAAQIADQFTSAIEGSLAIFPRRVLVPTDAWHRARRALSEAGLAGELTLGEGRQEGATAGPGGGGTWQRQLIRPPKP